jgi:hypothetical protein
LTPRRSPAEKGTETIQETDERLGVVTRVVCQLGIATEPLPYWVVKAESDGGRRA